LFYAASRGDTPELEAPLRAADAFKRLRSWEQELRARETLVRLLPSGSQASVIQGQRMEELKQLLTGPVLDLRFGGGNLNPAISLHSPQLLRVDARAERLLVRSFNDGLDLLSIPLVAASGPIQLELQLDIPRAERAGHLLFGLRQAGGGDSDALVGARFFAWGGGEQLNFQVVSQVRGQREPVFLQRQLDGPESAGRQHLLLEYDPARGTLFLRNNDELVEQQQAAGLIRPGMRLEFFMRATREPTGKALLEVGLSRLLLRGVSLLQEGMPGAANEAARALVEGRLELAEQLIKRLPEASERIPLAFILGMRVGDLSSQKEGLRVLWQQALARDPRAGSILNAALRDYPALILPRLFELGGGRVFSWIFDAWGSLIYAHPRDRTTILGLTSGMSALDGMSLPAHADEQERMLELELRACRARSWLRLDQQLMARSAIRQVLLLAAQVVPGLKRPQNRWDIKQLQSWLELDLAHSFAISGEVSPTVTHLSRAVSLSPQPELLLDEALARPELKAMRSHPELAAILPLTEYRLPGMESEHSH
jgi:hypothetical protein